MQLLCKVTCRTRVSGARVLGSWAARARGSRPVRPSMSFPSRRLLPLGLAALLALAALASPTASGQADLGAQADRLRDAVAAERARIASTRDGLADAEQRLAVLEARVTRRNAELQDAQDALVRSRIRLARLQRR